MRSEGEHAQFEVTAALEFQICVGTPRGTSYFNTGSVCGAQVSHDEKVTIN